MREGLKCWRTHNLTPKDTNSWLVLEPRISRITQIFFCKDFFYHKFPQIIFLLNLVESVWAFGENQRRASVRFPTHKENREICAICVSPRKQRSGASVRFPTHKENREICAICVSPSPLTVRIVWWMCDAILQPSLWRFCVWWPCA